MKTTKITVELSTQQLELIAPACKSLGCEPGELLLSLALYALEPNPPAECAREFTAGLLWCYAHKKETPQVDEEWAEGLDIDKRFVRPPYVKPPAELAAG